MIIVHEVKNKSISQTTVCQGVMASADDGAIFKLPLMLNLSNCRLDFQEFFGVLADLERAP